jgi:hypothetical protein
MNGQSGPASGQGVERRLARDPHVPRHLGFEDASSVEAAIDRAVRLHGPGASIGVVEQAGMPADPERRRGQGATEAP